LVENDYLKKQINVLKQQIDEKVREQRSMMESTFNKDREFRELNELMRDYEE